MEDTALHIGLLWNVLLLLAALSQNSHGAQKADAVFPHVDPNRLQFFEYESFSVNCSGFHGSTEWRVMKNTTRWETSTGSLNIKPAYVLHSGEYWCENGEGEKSNALNITVTGAGVILESPALPVMERQTVTLHCRKKATASNSAADFFKDGRFIKTDYTGNMTIHNISKSEEGLYKCSLSGAGESPESWLAVTVTYITPTPHDTTPQGGQEIPPHPPGPGSIQLSILLSAVFIILCVAVLLLVVGLLQCRKHRVACFSSELPTTGSDPVYEHVSVSDPQIATYANVTKPKKKQGCRKANGVDHTTDVTYAVVTKKKKERVSGEANVADPNKTTYAVVAKQRKERGH